MGHTVMPMRWVVYDKMHQLRRVVHALREPERTIALDLINHLYQNISTISYVNPSPEEIDDLMLFFILLQEKKKHHLLLNDFTLYLFSLMVTYKANALNHPDERNLHRLLQKAG